MRTLLQLALDPATTTPPDWTGFWPGVLRGIEDGRRAPAAAPRGAWRGVRWAIGGALVAVLLILATLSWWPVTESPETLVDPIVVSSAHTDRPGSSVMIYHTPQRDMAVVWVFGDDD